MVVVKWSVEMSSGCAGIAVVITGGAHELATETTIALSFRNAAVL